MIDATSNPSITSIEALGAIVRAGTSSREMEFEAWKVIAPAPEYGETAARVLEEPILVCKARGTCVIPKEKQRIHHD